MSLSTSHEAPDYEPHGQPLVYEGKAGSCGNGEPAGLWDPVGLCGTRLERITAGLGGLGLGSLSLPFPVWVPPFFLRTGLPLLQDAVVVRACWDAHNVRQARRIGWRDDLNARTSS